MSIYLPGGGPLLGQLSCGCMTLCFSTAWDIWLYCSPHNPAMMHCTFSDFSSSVLTSILDVPGCGFSLVPFFRLSPGQSPCSYVGFFFWSGPISFPVHGASLQVLSFLLWIFPTSASRHLGELGSHFSSPCLWHAAVSLLLQIASIQACLAQIQLFRLTNPRLPWDGLGIFLTPFHLVFIFVGRFVPFICFSFWIRSFLGWLLRGEPLSLSSSHVTWVSLCAWQEKSLLPFGICSFLFKNH